MDVSQAVETAPLPVAITATDARLYYIGRFDTSKPEGPRCGWSASAVRLKFQGSDLNVRLSGKGKNFLQVVVDGKPASVIEIKDGQTLYPVVSGLPAGEHSVELMKRAEFSQGWIQFQGFQLNEGGRLLPVTPLARKIEIVGDSISCGYGNEAAGKEVHFNPAEENAWKTYGAITARNVGAEYNCVAWSGKKLWPNNSILDYYDEVLPWERDIKWDFSKWIPDVVLINLGTNDFNGQTPDEAGWIEAYKKFIAQIRKNYPAANIYLALGTMMSDWPEDRKPATTIRGWLKKIVADENANGDEKVRFIDFGTQKPENGLGADWHPSLATHQDMAAQLTTRLKQDLGW